MSDRGTPTYPAGTMQALLTTDLVTPQTRRVLAQRLKSPPIDCPPVLDPTELATLRAVCARLIPQPDRAEPIDLAAAVHDRLARNEGNGWRYAAMPPDLEAYRLGVLGLDELAHRMGGAAFVDLEAQRQDAVLRAVQRGEVGKSWRALPVALFFEELLAELVECYYSHPLAQDEIGYVGYADAHGWQAVGLDKLASHEPRPLPPVEQG
jgi:gluconate 2-dehydrogenase gamma chain